MKNIFCLSLIFYFIFCQLNSYSKDTLQVKLNSIDVYSNKISSDNYLKITPSSILSDSLKDLINPIDIKDLLVLSPSLNILDYGGIGGMKSISLRSSTSSQSKITLNGINLNSSQNGGFDISLIPETMINKIEVIRSGLSAIYGSNAMNGVVNLISSYKQGIWAKISYGSFNTFLASFNTSNKINDFEFSTFFDYKFSKDNYPFEVNQFGNLYEYRRKNSEFKQFNFAINTKYNFQFDNLSLFILTNSKNNGVPGAVLQGKIENSEAFIKENNLFALLNYENIYNDIITKMSLSFKKNKSNFYDPLLIGTDGKELNSNFDNSEINLSVNSIFDFLVTNRIIIELNYSNLKGDFIKFNDQNTVDRTNLALAYNLEYLINLNNNNEIFLYLGIRNDLISGNYNQLSPISGISYTINDLNTSLHFNYSSNFRMPSFNELYYLNYGTSELRPEKSKNFNFSIISNIFDFLNIQTSLFYIDIQDQIQAVPISPLSWSAQNIANTENYGFELSSDIELIRNYISINFNYTIQSPKNKTKESPFYDNFIIYTPQEISNLFIFLRYVNFGTNLSFNYSSYRYSLQNNSIESIIPEYYLFNITIYYKLNIFDNNFKISLETRNIFDHKYQILKNYPMSGRAFIFSINYNI